MGNIIFATTNAGKVREVKAFLHNHNFNVISLKEHPGAPFPSCIEDGKDFLANAQKKARFYFDLLKEPVIADDSGLVVPVLNGQPGVLSARYAGISANDYDNNFKLLEKLNGVLPADRIGYFKAVIVYKDSNIEKNFEGICHGRILDSPRGNSGFGYDPLFYLEEVGKTFAELDFRQKNKYSHRGKAISELKFFLESFQGAQQQ